MPAESVALLSSFPAKEPAGRHGNVCGIIAFAVTKAVELLIKGRIRDQAKMLKAAETMDRLRRKAPAGWDSVKVLRKLRESR